MASSLASLISTGFLSRFLPRPMRPVAASVSRYFGSRTLSQHDYDRRDRSLEVNHRSSHTMLHHDNLFSEAFDLFYPTRSLSVVLNLIDQFTNNPFLSASRGVGAGIHLGWDAKETDDALHLRVDMPGLDKEDVKVSVVQNTLTIKGTQVGLIYPKKIYKIDQIKAEMKNGMLKVIVPNFKKEERNDLFQVKIW